MPDVSAYRIESDTKLILAQRHYGLHLLSTYQFMDKELRSKEILWFPKREELFRGNAHFTAQIS